MSYDMQHLGLCLSSNSVTAAVITAASDWVVHKVHHPIQVKRISFFVTTAVTAGQTTPQITVFSRPSSGSTVGQVSLGVLTIPNSASIGQVIYKELESVRVSAGSDLAFVISRAAADGVGAAGGGYVGALVLVDPEVPGSQTKMVASA